MASKLPDGYQHDLPANVPSIETALPNLAGWLDTPSAQAVAKWRRAQFRRTQWVAILAEHALPLAVAICYSVNLAAGSCLFGALFANECGRRLRQIADAHGGRPSGYVDLTAHADRPSELDQVAVSVVYRFQKMAYGGDVGFVTFVDGWLVFSGLRTNFAISPSDIFASDRLDKIFLQSWNADLALDSKFSIELKVQDCIVAGEKVQSRPSALRNALVGWNKMREKDYGPGKLPVTTPDPAVVGAVTPLEYAVVAAICLVPILFVVKPFGSYPFN